MENKRQLEELKTKRRQLTGSEEGDADVSNKVIMYSITLASVCFKIAT